jgi:YbgC/YbaW family acyl-CoA thioester hydrolase
MNEAAHAYLEQLGFPLHRLAERNVIGVPMVSLSVNYKRALKLGDRARIETSVTGIGKSSIRFTHRVLVDDEEAVEASEVRVYSVKTKDGGIAAAPVHDDVRVALLGAAGEKAT